MRNLLTLLAIAATLAFLAGGHYYWKEKTSGHFAGERAVVAEGAEGAESNDSVTERGEFDADLLSYISGWPEEARAGFEDAVRDGRAWRMAIVGSEALGADVGGWSVMLRDALEDVYGENYIDIGIYEFDMRSDEFIESSGAAEIAAFKPDMVLFEPFTLNDNGNVSVEDNHENITTFVEQLWGVNEEVVVVLQPPHPIHGASIYPVQVGQLAEFAAANGFEYVNHWGAWPDFEDEELREYLVEGQGAPNEQGHAVWFEYLREYFINE